MLFTTGRPHGRAHEFDSVDVVERKGVGHPDSLADGIAELASIRYSQYCLRNFGQILHHNLDKIAVFGGLAHFGWSEGEYVRPLRIAFGGRASTSFAGQTVPIEQILEAAATEQLRASLPGFAAVKTEFHHFTTDSSAYPNWFAPRDYEDLPELETPRSNDTAYVVACYPRTQSEVLALLAESFFRGFDWTGSDIKVLVVREGHTIQVACTVPGLVGAFEGAAAYRDAAHGAKVRFEAELRHRVDSDLSVSLRAVDDIPATGDVSPIDCYVNLSGSAIDYGEDGLVGRGNGREGIIAPARDGGNEVLFGKNPAYMVGKVGAYLADKIAREVAGLAGSCRVRLAYRRGAAYDDPFLCNVVADASDRAVADVVRNVLSERDWIGDLVNRECYLPRVYSLGPLLAELVAAPCQI